MVARRNLDWIPKSVAIHEAGHAVVSWISQMRLGWDWAPFHRVLVRSRREQLSGPYIDWRGREVDCSGLVEASDRYGSFGGVDCVPIVPKKLYAQWTRNMEADVVDLLAGSIAEAKFRHVSRFAAILVGGREDHDAAMRKLSDFAWIEDEQWAWLHRLRPRERDGAPFRRIGSRS